MSDDAEAPEDKAGEPKPPKIKAEDNPWYLLATLYGVPFEDRKLREKNRIAWNRYFAANLDEETRTKLIEEKRHRAEELTPFSPEELQEIQRAFRERCKASAKDLGIPASDARIDFSNVDFKFRYLFSHFEFYTSFEGYLFSRWTVFDGATFAGGATQFDGATFAGGANFDGAAFAGGAHFNGAAFSGPADFDRATFPGWALFRGASFSNGATFRGVTFSGPANFSGAAVSRRADFEGTTFSGEAWFSGAIFSGVAYFRTATFGKESRFVNVEMKGETSFEGAKFKSEPPQFFGANLHQGTVWRGIKKWPLPKNKGEAGTYIDAYACLKLEMDRLKKHEDELDFFALEMQSRRVLQGPVRGLPIWLYGILSNYGRSYVRPLAWLYVIAVACAAVFRHFGTKASIDSLGLSLANLLSVFGFRKDFNLPIDSLPVALKILAATQTIVGGALLFLVGLGIRNKFRMK